ncbi:MAG: hypothetical protein OYH76_24920 [Defluviicoccus sp.]|nr:hypothetical protein [Defluviicoccus sp.]MDE0279151.1 hypothetical protein [Defluviicoccus sp.]
MTVPLDRRLESAPGPLFAPMGLALPLRVEQTGRDAFDTDPALASFTLRSARAALEADAMAAGFDHAGVPSEATLALTRRLADEIGGDATVLGTLPAPAAPGGAGTVEDAARRTTAAVEGLCGAGAGALVMLEAAEDPDPAPFRGFDAAFNLAAYYQVPVLYLARHAQAPGVLDAARAAGARWAVGPGDADGAVASVPLDLFDGDGAAASAWAAGLPRGVRLYVSSWEIPAGKPVEAVAAVRRALCA